MTKESVIFVLICACLPDLFASRHIDGASSFLSPILMSLGRQGYPEKRAARGRLSPMLATFTLRCILWWAGDDA
jgi:hypothetical protein